MPSWVYVLSLLFIKYISDKYADIPYAPITVPKGASFADMVALKGKPDIGDQLNKKIVAPLAEANQHLSQADFPDFNDAVKLGDGKEKVDRLTDLISIFQNPALDFSKNRAEGDDILGDAYEYLMRHFATESGKSKGQFYTPAEVSRVIAAMCDRVQVMRHGEFVEAGPSEDIFYRPQHPYTSMLLDAMPRLDKPVRQGHISLKPLAAAVRPACRLRATYSPAGTRWSSGRLHQAPA